MGKILSSIISLLLIPIMLLVTCLLWIIGIDDSDSDSENERDNE